MKRKEECLLDYKYSFFFIMAASTVARIILLITSERLLDMDECVVGIMAKRIAKYGEVYIHLLGSDYGGGHALIAYLEAPFFKIFGASDILVQSVTVFFSLLIVLIMIILISKLASPVAGLLSGLFLSFFPPFLKASFEVNGYIETIFFALLSGYFLTKLCCEPEDAHVSKTSDWKRFLYLIFFGFFSGLALWCFQFAIVFLCVFFVVVITKIRKFKIIDIVIITLCFLLGFSLELNNAMHNEGPGIINLFSRWVFVDSSQVFLNRIITLSTYYFPRFFSARIYRYSNELPIYAVFLFIMFIASWMYLSLKASIDQHYRKQQFLILILFPLFFLIALSLFSRATTNPRYMLPLALVIAGAFGINAAAMIQTNRRALALVILILTLEIWGCVHMTTIDELNNGDRNNFLAMVDFFEERGIKGVYSRFETKWPVAFYSNEKVIGSDFSFNQMPRYMPYEHRMKELHNIAYAFKSEEPILEQLETFLNKRSIEFYKEEIGIYTIIYFGTTVVRPQDWMYNIEKIEDENNVINHSIRR